MTELDLQRLLRMIEEAVGTEKKDSEDIMSYFQECYQLGVEILPLDINQSQVTCSVEHGKNLRLGLSAIASGSNQYVEDIIAERQKNGPFQNFQDFCERIDLDSVPLSFCSRGVEAGIFDAIEDSRARLLAGHEKILQAVRKSKAEHSANQISLFDVLPASSQVPLRPVPLPEVEVWTEEEIIEHEKRAVGFSFTEYFLQQDEGSSEESGNETEGSEVEESGDVRELPKNPIETLPDAPVTSEDEVERIPLPPEAFSPEVLEASLSQGFESDIPDQESILESVPDIISESEIEAAISEAAQKSLPSQLVLQLAATTTTEADLLRLKEICEQHSGDVRVLLEFTGETQNKTLMKTHDDYCVAMSEELIEKIEAIIGEHATRILFGQPGFC